MKTNYKDTEEYFLDLIEILTYSENLTIDFTSTNLNLLLTETKCTVLDYLTEELWDDATSFGTGNTYTFGLPLSEKDINHYSQLWKPKWNFLRAFFTALNCLGVEQVAFYLGDFK